MDEQILVKKIREILHRGHDVEIKSCKDGIKIVEVLRVTAVKSVDF